MQDIAAQVRDFGTGGAVIEEMLSRILWESVTGALLGVRGDSHGRIHENIQSKNE